MQTDTTKHLFENEILRTFLAQLKEGVVITTPKLERPDPIILYANEHLQQITGYTYEELVGKSPRILQGKDSNRAMLAKLKAALSEGFSFTGETTNYRKDGTAYQVELTISPIFDENEELQYYIGIQRDITAKKEMQQAMLQAEKYQLETEAQRRLKKRLAEFAFALTQQLRDPLSVIRLNAEALQWYREQLSEIKQKQKLATIMGEVDYLVELLNDVAIVSKISTSEDDIQRSVKLVTVDISQIVGDIVRRTLDQDWMPQPEIHIIKEGEFVPVDMDQHLLRHIIGNLLTNAIRYSPNSDGIDLYVQQTPKNICIRVSDKGYGIPAEAQAHLFDSFFRATNARNTVGTGLGLTIVKTSVDALNGTITLESTEGVGTTVEVNLPIRES